MALAIKRVCNLPPHPTNHLVKEFSKLVHICQSYYRVSNIKWLTFWGHSVVSPVLNIFVKFWRGQVTPPPTGALNAVGVYKFRTPYSTVTINNFDGNLILKLKVKLELESW